MVILRRMWKDFTDFWRTQVIWAFLLSATAFIVQWRKGSFAGGKFAENVIDNLVPYGTILGVFVVGNVARTFYLTERDEVKRKRRLTRREEHRAERKAESERAEQAKPKPPKPNLQFRRIVENRLWFGHEISGHSADVVLIEVGNELTDKIVGKAENVRAHVTYQDSVGKQLQIRCPGFWSGENHEEFIPAGESRYLLITVLKGSYWMTDMYNGIPLNSRIKVEVRLLDKAGQPLADTMFFELGIGNSRYPTCKHVQAAS